MVMFSAFSYVIVLYFRYILIKRAFVAWSGHLTIISSTVSINVLQVPREQTFKGNFYAASQVGLCVVYIM